MAFHKAFQLRVAILQSSQYPATVSVRVAIVVSFEAVSLVDL